MIIVITRCLNETPAMIRRFIHGYGFADKIIISDGGSNNGCREYLQSLLYHNSSIIDILDFPEFKIINNFYWNPDNPHINFIIDKAKEYNPDWIIMDDMDDVPNHVLRGDAEWLLEWETASQVNVFRLYMWGDKQYFPKMNNYFDPLYTSLWAWKPKEVNIYADNDKHHGTISGVSQNPVSLDIPYCLLHKSWHPDTIEAKMKKYNSIGIEMHHPLVFAGTPVDLPEFAVEELETEDD